MLALLEEINGFVWGVPVLGLILCAGVWLSLKSRWVQLRLLRKALGEFWRRLRGDGEDGSFRALCTALAATVGTGNIAGVAGAIAIGGPGAVFWMWISAILGMAVKFAESTLAVRYRVQTAAGEWLGGPMYYMTQGLGKRWRSVACVYCVFGICAAFGVGNAAQISAVMESGRAAGETLGLSLDGRGALVLGLALAMVVFWRVRRGAGGVGRAAELLIPVVSAVYIALCLLALWLQRGAIPQALTQIVRGAFAPEAVTGGAVGSAFTTLRIGVSRGTFTNEAGMGTAAIAHAGANVDHPVRQGLMGIMEVFLDTIVICTLTALVILTSGADVSYGASAGAELTARALAESFGPWVTVVLWGCLCLFALATILGWSLYAGRCLEFLFGKLHWGAFSLCQAVCVVLSAVVDAQAVWTVSELFNGLMAIPNLLALGALTPKLLQLTREWECAIIGKREKTQRGNTHERKRNRGAPTAHPPGPQQYDRHPRLLRQRGR